MSDLIHRCELFNKLATIPAPAEANEYKAAVYAAINEMDAVEIPEKEINVFACPIVEDEDDYWVEVYSEYDRGKTYAWEIAQKVFDTTLTFEAAETYVKRLNELLSELRTESEK